MIERGAVYLMASRGTYTGKPRPAVILQNEDLQIRSVIVLPLTSEAAGSREIRVELAPDDRNGLRSLSYVMCDKITAIPTASLRERIGSIDAETVRRIEAAVLTVLGFPD